MASHSHTRTQTHAQAYTKGKCFGCIIRFVLHSPGSIFCCDSPEKKNDDGEKNKFQIEIKTIYNENPSEH